MHTLPEIIDALKRFGPKPQARCAIESSDAFFESSLMGTRDAYLNAAIALLQIVAGSERKLDEPWVLERIEEKHAMWSDNLQKAFHQLPGNHPFIIGCYLFDNHNYFLAALEELVNPSLPNGAMLTTTLRLRMAEEEKVSGPTGLRCGRFESVSVCQQCADECHRPKWV